MSSTKIGQAGAQDPRNHQRESELHIVKNVFYNEETLKYMKIIDMYKKLGIGKDIELPRLVVAGAQSCGKSSLLENLTGLPVPITTGIGTRFPIEITLIEDPTKSQIKPSIILDPKIRDMSAVDKEKIQKFNLGQVYHDPMTRTEFENLLREASDILGVPPPVFAGDKAVGLKTIEASTQISSHVLQIEMRGKDFKSLSFVDTPGLYHAGNSEQDVKSVDEIESLVTSLIAENRTLIVGVMEATQSTVGQKIFKFADDVDVSGQRTIGVMTKCDLAVMSDTDAFEATLRRARNQERILQHGWYVVKNRSSTETKSNVSLNASRKKESRLFAGEAWRPTSSGLSSDRMGIWSLRAGLSNVFCAHIRAEFPAFDQQTRTILNKRRADLAALGPARSTVSEQRDYLNMIFNSYRSKTQLCLKENFSSSRDLSQGSVPLERRLAKKRAKLRDALRLYGALFSFQTPSAESDICSDDAASASYTENTTNIYTWINDRYQQTKSGILPGIIPSQLIEKLFEEQIHPWRTITDLFVQRVKNIFTTAIVYSLRPACANDNVYTGLERLVRAKVDAKMEIFKLSCHDLISKERKGMQIIACEEQFMKDIREARTLRLLSALSRLETVPPPATNLFGWGTSAITSIQKSEGAGGMFSRDSAERESSHSTSPFSTTPSTQSGFGGFGALSTPKSDSLFGTPNPPKPSFTSIAEFAKRHQTKLVEALTHERQVVYEIHDILKAYYNISVQHYTDLVCRNQLNETFTIEVMGLFSEDLISQLSEIEISEIAAESAADRKVRRELNEDIEKLEMVISESEAILGQAVALQ